MTTGVQGIEPRYARLWFGGLGREADWRDFLANACGTGLGMLVSLAGLRHWVRWLEKWPRRP